jgi:hypothetical protein
MIAVDTNILVYAHRLDMEFLRRASAAIAGLAESSNIVSFRQRCAGRIDVVHSVRRTAHISPGKRSGQNAADGRPADLESARDFGLADAGAV